MSRLPFSRRTHLLLLWIAGAALALGVFFGITDELLEQNETIDRFDNSVVEAITTVRIDWLNGVAVDITALASFSVVTIISLTGLVLLISTRDTPAVLHLLAASIGSGIWTQILKNTVERERPHVVEHLVHVAGFSYPSGHSLTAAAMYLTLGFLAMRHVPRRITKMILLALAVTLILLIGLSRVYLGVHYPSDVISGLSLGSAWALLLAGVFSWWYGVKKGDEPGPGSGDYLEGPDEDNRPKDHSNGGE